MLLSLGVYWAAFGWAFALGLVLSIYVHEMGHVAALRRYGIAASAPMFIPGLGALVRLKQYPVDPREDARVGLAGPLWGLGAAAVAYGVGHFTGWSSWLAIARVGAWINLFNLVPLWQLDGGRGFRALTRGQRIIAAIALGVDWWLTSEGMLLLVLGGAVIRIFQKDAPTQPDRRALVEYVAIAAALSALAATHVPGMSGALP
jgi:Zn-dependent protease